MDDVGNPLANQTVLFNINGVFYNRQSNASGYANLNIRLQPDEYIVTAEYKGYMHSNIVKVLPVLFGNDTESHVNESNFCVKLIDGQGLPYANQSIEFNINGLIYTNITNENGIANLFVNLAKGEYLVTSSYDEYNINNKITMKWGDFIIKKFLLACSIILLFFSISYSFAEDNSTVLEDVIIDANDISMYYKDGTRLNVGLYDSSSEHLANQSSQSTSMA